MTPRHARNACHPLVALALIAPFAIEAGASRAASAETRSSAPFVAIGFAEKLRRDMVIPTMGWRWHFGPGETLGGWGSKISTDFSFVVEPSLAAVFGDKDSFEAQVVPFFRVEPAAMRTRSWSPYFEAGIGLIYTGLDGLHLGSHVLFSDNAGGGLAFDAPALPATAWKRVNVGYRFRHISHAGIFGQPNSGMNTHYLTITFQ